MKTMKTIRNQTYVIALIFAISIISFSLSAQEKEKEKENKTVKIKTVKIVDGKETVIDTCFEFVSLEDLESIQDIEILLGDDIIKDLDLKLEALDELEDIDVKIMVCDDSLKNMEKHMIFVSEKMSDNEDKIKNIEVMFEMCDSVSGEKTLKVTMDEDGEHIYVINGENMEGIKWVQDGDEDILKTMDIMVDICDSVSGEKIIKVEIDGDGEHVYVIDGENMEDVKWVQDGNEKVVVIKSTHGMNEDCIGKKIMVHEMDGNVDGEKEVFVEVIKTGDGDSVIETTIILCSPNDEDQSKLEKAGIDINSESEKDKLKLEDLSFFPNPSNGKFNLKFEAPEKGDIEIDIYDINGKKVYNDLVKNFDGQYKKEIDISDEHKGTYFLKISQGKKATTRKIILD